MQIKKNISSFTLSAAFASIAGLIATMYPYFDLLIKPRLETYDFMTNKSYLIFFSTTLTLALAAIFIIYQLTRSKYLFSNNIDILQSLFLKNEQIGVKSSENTGSLMVLEIDKASRIYDSFRKNHLQLIGNKSETNTFSTLDFYKLYSNINDKDKIFIFYRSSLYSNASSIKPDNEEEIILQELNLVNKLELTPYSFEEACPSTEGKND